MPRRLQDGLGDHTPYNVREGWDPNDLLHPAQAFEHPSHVVYDADLTLNEKRAILASWVSDACAAGGEPHLRCAPGWPNRYLLQAREQYDRLGSGLPPSDRRPAQRGIFPVARSVPINSKQK